MQLIDKNVFINHIISSLKQSNSKISCRQKLFVPEDANNDSKDVQIYTIEPSTASSCDSEADNTKVILNLIFPEKKDKVKKWPALDRNLLMYMSERQCSRDLFSKVLGREKGLVYSKLQKHMIMLTEVKNTVDDIIKEQKVSSNLTEIIIISFYIDEIPNSEWFLIKASVLNQQT